MGEGNTKVKDSLDSIKGSIDTQSGRIEVGLRQVADTTAQAGTDTGLGLQTLATKVRRRCKGELG